MDVARVRLGDIAFSPTAALYEGAKHAPGSDISAFIVHQQPGGFVELHWHPYAETFFVIAGRGRWTAGDVVEELEADDVIVVPPETLHGFRNIGDEELHVLSVHESGTLEQTFTEDEPA
jgi:mannose-6-phosphate isomerase-like protein (cupin superfamily)